MSCGWADLRPGLALLVLPVVAAAPLAAQVPQVREVGVQAVGALSDPAQATGGVYAAVRPGGRFRIAAFAGAGVQDDRFSVRGELVGHFLLSPYRLHGPGLYAGGGIAGVAGPVDRGYVVLVLGVEQSPFGRSGWAVEAGIGGGARIAVGWRWRLRHYPRSP